MLYTWCFQNPHQNTELALGCSGLHICFPCKLRSPMLECGFESLLGFEFSGFSICHFLKLVVSRFSQGTLVSSPPLLVNCFSQQNKTKNKYSSNSVKLNCWAVPLYHRVHNMLHVIGAWSAAHNLHRIAPLPLEHVLETVLGLVKKLKKNIDLYLSISFLLLSSLTLIFGTLTMHI